MSENEPQLPENLRQALKNKAAYTPSESFYTDVLRKIRAAPEPRSHLFWIWGTPMKLATVMGVIMISYFAAQDKTPWGPKKAEVVYDQASSVSRTPAMAQGPALPQTMAFKDMKTFYGLAKEKRSEETLREVSEMNKKSFDALTSVNSNLPARKIQDKVAAIIVPDARDAEEPGVAGGIKFPWQSQLQARQTVSESKSMVSTFAQSPSSAAAPVVLAGNMGAAKMAFTWQGTDSGIGSFRTAVITTVADWAVLWRAHKGTRPAPAIDFNQWMVVGIFAGTRSDLAVIDIVDVHPMRDHMVVTYREIPAGPAQSIGNPTNRPYALQVVPKTALPVHFQKTN